ncbi:MAG TPA: aryl-sulfate sulfotransferase [Candidatus Mediterraneibacter excrementipullorum]|nr:aryl-sulfate sulfotransferase [Candidatus Mediterraneibacter excrementipullorum]
MRDRRKIFGKHRKKSKWKIIAALGCIVTAGAAFSIFYASANGEKEVSDEDELRERVSQISEVYTEEYQEKVKERLEKVKASGEYTEDHMLIEPDPFGTNSLSLYVYFKTDEPARVSYSVSVDDVDISDFSAVPDSEKTAETEHEFQVIGLVPGLENRVTFTVAYEDGMEETFKYIEEDVSIAGEEEIRLSTEDVSENADAELSDGLYVILGNDSDELDYMYYYDNEGVLRGEVPLIGYRSHRLLFRDGLMYYSISETKIAAIDSLGMVEAVYDLGSYELHHDYGFDEDGNLLILATDTESNTVEDQVIRVDTQTGEITGTLDLRQLFPDYMENFVDGDSQELDWIHINTLQYLEDETLILSSRETSSIIKVSDAFSDPKIEYMIGDEGFWEGTGYEDLLMQKDETGGVFSDTGGQHSVTYVWDDSLPDGQYYLYMFNNNFGISESREYDWSAIEGIETSMKEGENSFYYKYLVDENKGTYRLEESFEVPFSAYVSSAQEYNGNIVIDSGMAGVFGEYDQDGNLLREYEMELAKNYIYRVYKYDFSEFLTILD